MELILPVYGEQNLDDVWYEVIDRLGNKVGSYMGNDREYTHIGIDEDAEYPLTVREVKEDKGNEHDTYHL